MNAGVGRKMPPTPNLFEYVVLRATTTRNIRELQRVSLRVTSCEVVDWDSTLCVGYPQPGIRLLILPFSTPWKREMADLLMPNGNRAQDSSSKQSL
jgi:hypothetical protein